MGTTFEMAVFQEYFLLLNFFSNYTNAWLDSMIKTSLNSFRIVSTIYKHLDLHFIGSASRTIDLAVSIKVIIELFGLVS